MEVVLILVALIYLVYKLALGCAELEHAIENECSGTALMIHLLWLLMIVALLVLGAYMLASRIS